MGNVDNDNKEIVIVNANVKESDGGDLRRYNNVFVKCNGAADVKRNAKGRPDSNVKQNDSVDVRGNVVADMKRSIDIDLNIINAVKGIVSAADDGEGKVDVNGIVDVDSKRNSNADVKGNVVGINGNVGVKEIIGVDSFEHVRNNSDVRDNRNVDPESNVDSRRNAFSNVKQNVNNVGLKGNVDEYFEGKGDVKGSVDDDDVKNISDGDVDGDLEGGTRVDSERNVDVVVEGNFVIAEQIADKSSLTEP